MIMSATALLSRNASPTEEEIRIGLSGNLCRCTGYAKILAAVQSAAAAQRLSSRADASSVDGASTWISIEVSGRRTGALNPTRDS